MPTQHALLSASSSNRWIHCPPSVRLSEQFENKTSDFARQGTDAHTLCEYKLHKLLGDDVEDPTPSLEFYDEEMEQCAESYATFVMEEVAKARQTTADPIVIVEQQLDFSRFVPDGFGTGDCLVIADGTLSVIDMKYGLGILVDAYQNPQMMCYALGALELFDGIYDIQEVKMTIFQPRRENVSTYTLPKEELLQWANEVLAPAAQLAYKGEGEYQCGKWCGFCPAKNKCRARAEQNLELAKYEFKKPDLLEDDEIEVILEKVDDLVSWSNDIKEYALKLALDGKQWANHKLVEGRSTRKYSNDNNVAAAVIKAGYDPYDKKLLGVTAMTKTLGKAKFDELLSDYIIKPPGKLTLVTNDDKRQAVTINNVNEEFNILTEDQ
ncbi:DUF2800 domain-containing protein [Listeria monocytogenes]|uniref:DUF2800 domain-containing protein n=1 Tax=Listeria monocytogenes TaxID=1639 RepID=A0AAD2RBB8_LISMN|nr:DUF2800 domain-containing protein [Enterococcus lactis]EAA0054524.1 DUF2800 domain-containing protein [Listeria monocytogenes]EAA0073369.1 DUF2800 domain-containing protein [Listeria monocytogenes]EAA0387470.1 DUF2800 domain-containing protein [Listeria monocytogenes]EAC4738733.1 DUF2800 domain-containing protein [Listeria monocytogenes]EAC5623783.1 DUF2800 domain-containing protein [Listeria monocytogenes]